ncbi:MAG: hypothetical protein ACRCYU_21595 [Nocardioides sp.]
MTEPKTILMVAMLMIRMTSLSGKVTVAASGVVVSWVLLSGCGTQVEPLGAAEAVAVEAEVNGVYRSIWGTDEQRNAARYLGWRAMTDPVTECMGDRSQKYYRYFVPTFRGGVSGPTEEWIGPLDLRQSDIALANTEAINLERNSGEGPAWVQTKEYRAADAACQSAEGDPTAFNPPTDVQELSSKFRKILSEVDHDLGSIDDYHDCMRDRGHEVNQEGDGATGLSNYLSARLPTPPLPGVEPSAEWLEFLTFEDGVLKADRACREDKHNEGIARMAPEVEKFTAEHADDLAKAADQWSTYLEQAREIGFQDPDGIK